MTSGEPGLVNPVTLSSSVTRSRWFHVTVSPVGTTLPQPVGGLGRVDIPLTGTVEHAPTPIADEAFQHRTVDPMRSRGPKRLLRRAHVVVDDLAGACVGETSGHVVESVDRAESLLVGEAGDVGADDLLRIASLRNSQLVQLAAQPAQPRSVAFGTPTRPPAESPPVA